MSMCRVRMYLLLLLIVAILQTPASLNWIEAPSPTLPRKKQAITVGFYEGSIFLLGGQPGFTEVVEYNINHNNFTHHPNLTDPQSAFSNNFVQIGYIIYMIRRQNPRWITTYNMKTKMYNNQTMHSNTYINDQCMTQINDEYLFLLGGYSGRYMTTFQILFVKENKWIDGPPLPQARAYTACNAHNHILYVIAGSNETQRFFDSIITLTINDILNTNINKTTWSTMLDTLSIPRVGPQSIVYNDFIYIIGGWYGVNGKNVIDEVEIIDTKTNSIYLDSTLIRGIYRTSAIIANNKIFLFGGLDNALNRLDMQYANLQPTKSPSLSPTLSPTLSPIQTFELLDTKLPHKMNSFCTGVLNEQITTIGGNMQNGGFGPTYTTSLDMIDINTSVYWTVHYDINKPFGAGFVYFQGESCVQSENLLFGVPIFSGPNSTWHYGEKLFIFNLIDQQYIDSNVYNNTLMTPTKNSCVVFAADILYVIGGITGSKVLNITQSYNTNTNKWKYEASLTQKRYGLACVTALNNIYVFGGRYGFVNDEDIYGVLGSIEVLNLNNNTWNMLSNVTLSTPRYFHSCLYSVDLIYCIGGYSILHNIGSYLSSVEIFDTFNSKLTKTYNVITLNAARYTHSMAMIITNFQSTILILGGSNGTDLFNSIEILSMATKNNNDTAKTTLFPSNMPSNMPSYQSTEAMTETPSNEATVMTSYSYSTTSTMQTIETDSINRMWIVKVGANCPDGFTDLNINDKYYGLYCQQCPSGTAGTYGICNQCTGIKQPNDFRTECQVSWWIYLIATLSVLFGAIIIFLCYYIRKRSTRRENENMLNIINEYEMDNFEVEGANNATTELVNIKTR